MGETNVFLKNTTPIMTYNINNKEELLCQIKKL